MKLWWPHAEAIYAVILAFTMTGDSKWLEWLERLDDYAFAHFSDPDHGEWFGYLNRRGEVLLPLKGGKWKGCFHVPRGLFRCWKIFEGLAKE